jgi:phytoene dehydrogenase-like protein
MPDAVVIGAGHNGLVAANLLADEGWDVLVLEAEDVAGGAVRTAELTLPGYQHDVFSAFYPLSVASPIIQGLRLEDHGLRWVHAPAVLAHPLPDGRAAVLSRDLDVTAASLDTFASGDGDSWRELFGRWERVFDDVMGVLFTPFPPVIAGARLAAKLGPADALRYGRQAVLTVRRLGEEEFDGEGGPLLLAGNALHTDLAPDGAGSAAFGWLLTSLGQQVGFPVPQGGAARLIDALVARLETRGGRVVCGARVTRIEIRNGGAVGVVTANGQKIPATRGVFADVDAPRLYLDLVGEEHLAPRVVADLRRFEYDASTFKVDWALSGKVPWTADGARGAGTVHVADGLDQMTWYQAHLSTKHVPADPFLLVGQMATADPTRAPEGHEVLWAYTHVPRQVRGDAGGDGITGRWDQREQEAFADRMEAIIERYAPGFRDRILERHILGPPDLEAANANLVGGAVNAGTSQLHQQLVFRPVPGLGRPETPIRNLYLAGASAHPGGGVHGGPGANAARAALNHERMSRAKRIAVLGLGAAAAAEGWRRWR